jgi:hypothetical protein
MFSTPMRLNADDSRMKTEKLTKFHARDRIIVSRYVFRQHGRTIRGYTISCEWNAGIETGICEERPVPLVRDCCDRLVWPDRPVAAGSLSNRDSRVHTYTHALYMHKHTCVQPVGDTFTCCQCPIGSSDAGPISTES